ncbi:MAG: metal ABC transporter permease [Treponema sp.]|uniref:metal ABC transporter permease n=1 Tax=Treponema sp. TaxID=166 RepID=UPI00298DBA37|nr:metal ABC transporter permease [Treponema sp.]MCR5385584.1 metal ABC transporter permease [Treponema sp.]
MNVIADLFLTLKDYFTYDNVRYALIVTVFISLASSLLGVTLVLKRFSFIGDGLSHTAFGAMAIATVLKITNTNLLVMPLTVICAVILLALSNNSKAKGDANLALISVTSMALGYFLMNVFSTAANVSGDVCSTLFGSTAILTLTISDVWLCVIASLIVVVLYIFYYHNIFAVTFDEQFAQASGINVVFYNFMIAIVTAVVIVLAMNLVGSLLITALIVFPALAAMKIFKSFKQVIIGAAIFSIVTSVLGVLFSILRSTPVGATIVISQGIFYIAVFLCSLKTAR